MRQQQKNKYPKNWHDIALRKKIEKDYTCQCCHKKATYKTAYLIQVHHIDGNKQNCQDWNLKVCCDRCHTIAEKKTRERLKEQRKTEFDKNLAIKSKLYANLTVQ